MRFIVKVLSDTSAIPSWRVTLLFILGPVIAPVYLMYAVGYAMLRRGVSRVITSPYLVLFSVLNIVHNWTVCTLLFSELPREFFTTQRLRRWKLSDDKGRRELADLMGGFLNRHDIGHY